MIDRVDFENSLLHPISDWGKKSKAEVAALLGEDTARMVGFEQHNPHHCYDLYFHVLHTVAGLDDTASTMLRTAAFFHDIGKPAVMMEKHGRYVFYDHAKKSADLAEPILEKLGYTLTERLHIIFLIRHHDDFISWVLPEEDYDRNNPYHIEITAGNLHAHMEQCNDFPGSDISLWKELLQLCRADASAQSDKVYKDGVLIFTKEQKLKKIQALFACLFDC